jgi:hypothetical protein
MQNFGNGHTAKLLVFALFTVLSLAGCGKKDWPSVQEQEDVVTFESISVEREAECLAIAARLEGAVQNLAGVLLELEEGSEACSHCPFQPRTRIFLERSDPRLTMNGSRLSISYCELEGDPFCRLRLSGDNRIPGIKDSVSNVLGPFAP